MFQNNLCTYSDCTYTVNSTVATYVKRNSRERRDEMETDEEVAIIATMLRKILISVGKLAKTVSDMKEKVRTLKEETELAHELEAKARQKSELEAKSRIPDTAAKPSRVKLPKMLQGKKQQLPPDFKIGDIVRFTDDETKVGSIERISEKSVWVKLPRIKSLQLKRKHKITKIDNDV